MNKHYYVAIYYHEGCKTEFEVFAENIEEAKMMAVEFSNTENSIKEIKAEIF